jgi:hypothetical protein
MSVGTVRQVFCVLCTLLLQSALCGMHIQGSARNAVYTLTASISCLLYATAPGNSRSQQMHQRGGGRRSRYCLGSKVITKLTKAMGA